MYSIIQFIVKNYSSDNICKFCFYDFILIVLWLNFGHHFFLISIHFINLIYGSKMKMNMEVTYGQKLQLHMYHIHQRL